MKLTPRRPHHGVSKCRLAFFGEISSGSAMGACFATGLRVARRIHPMRVIYVVEPAHSRCKVRLTFAIGEHR